MADSVSIIEGLRIIQKYEKDGWFICAEHDVIYAGDSKLSDEDDTKVRELGWFRDDDELDGPGEENYGEGTWQVFT